MKRVFSILLTALMLCGLFVPVFAGGVASVTVGPVPVPAAGKLPAQSVDVSVGRVVDAEWSRDTGGKKVPMAAGETFAAGSKYYVVYYILPPDGMQWQELEEGGVIYTDMPDVKVTARSDSGREIPVDGCYLFDGQLLVALSLDCPGTPAPEPDTEEIPEQQTPLASPVVPGLVVGTVLSTDIRAYINGAEIPAYNVDGKLAVLVSDLNSYGFKTTFDNTLRKTSVKRDRSATKFTSVPSKASGLPIGTPVMSVLSTDIRVELDGKEVTAFNVDNRMAIYFTELKQYGEVVYDNATRSSSLKLK